MQQLNLEKELEIYDASGAEGQRYLFSNIVERYNIAASSYYKALTMKPGFEPRIALKEGLKEYVKLEHQD